MVILKKEELTTLFSEFWSIDQSEIKDDLPLDDKTLKNQSSIRFYQFIAAVESNFDVTVRNINDIHTFKDLYENIKEQ